MTKKSSSQGIAHLGLILGILVVIAAVAFGGWYVWDKNKDDKGSNSSKNSSQTNNSQSQNEEPSDPSEGGKYLVIEEWDVRFELPEELRGTIYYVPDKNRTDTMVIDSKSFPDGAECVSFGLARTKERVENPTSPEGFNSSSVAHIGGYYYSRLTGVIACSDREDVHSEAAQVQRQLYESAEAIEVTP